MPIVWSLIVGLVGGVLGMYAVYRTTPSDAGQWIGALVIGLLGGWLGGGLLNLLGLQQVNWLGALVVAFLGAALIFMGIRRMSGPTAERP